MDCTPKLVAFDLDGTLAESKQPVTKEMGKLLAKLLHKMPVAVMSGGAYHQFEKQLLPALPSDAQFENLYLFPTSAGRCYMYKNSAWQTVYDHSFSEEEKATVLKALHEALVETGLDQPPPQLWGEQIEDRGAQISWSALGQQAPIEEKKKWDPDRKKRMPLRDAFLKRVSDFSVGVNATNTIDITRKGITKAYGIEQLSTMSGISINEMLYVGDALGEGGNDAVVIPTGVRTHEVSGPTETAALIEEIVRA
ncbi:MAG TPA: HAD-IIB family hydrolase [Candidatus Paceibacterota bacterium]|nr:HAD-IIB family hydrolase [Candidatus Paceibacterota bacterium]